MKLLISCAWAARANAMSVAARSLRRLTENITGLYDMLAHYDHTWVIQAMPGKSCDVRLLTRPRRAAIKVASTAEIGVETGQAMILSIWFRRLVGRDALHNSAPARQCPRSSDPYRYGSAANRYVCDVFAQHDDR